MIFHVLTIFPDFFEGPFAHGVVAKAREAGVLEIRIHNLRDWTSDRHKTVDDRPFGGGEGMVLKPEPLFQAVETDLAGAAARAKGRAALGAGTAVRSGVARRAQPANQELLLICGRYEGVDERVAEHLADEELSIGNYVLSGGELAAAVVIDTVARLLPGVLGNEASTVCESFQRRARPGPARLPAVDATCGISRLEGPGGAAERESRRDPQMADEGGARRRRRGCGRICCSGMSTEEIMKVRQTCRTRC